MIEIISIIEYKVEQIGIQNGTHNWWSDYKWLLDAQNMFVKLVELKLFDEKLNEKIRVIRLFEFLWWTHNFQITKTIYSVSKSMKSRQETCIFSKVSLLL